MGSVCDLDIFLSADSIRYPLPFPCIDGTICDSLICILRNTFSGLFDNIYVSQSDSEEEYVDVMNEVSVL